MITLSEISVQFDGKTVVQDVSATAKPGEFIALVGPNGSGKSSLLKAIAGLVPHTGSTNLPKDHRTRAKQLAYLAQTVTAPHRHLVRNIVTLGRTPHIGGLSTLGERDKNAVTMAMTQAGVTEFADRMFGTLSGGEQTRVHLARALSTQAPLLLADEPITALDPYYQLSVMQVLREAAQQGTTVIAALHDLSLAERFCDRIWVMNTGRLVANDTSSRALTAEILRDVFRITPDGQITV